MKVRLVVELEGPCIPEDLPDAVKVALRNIRIGRLPPEARLTVTDVQLLAN